MQRTATLSRRGTTSPWHVAVAIMMSLALAAPARAQGKDKIYDMAEISTPPRLASSAQAIRLINASYPRELKSKGIGGTAQLEFVVAIEPHSERRQRIGKPRDPIRR